MTKSQPKRSIPAKLVLKGWASPKSILDTHFAPYKLTIEFGKVKWFPTDKRVTITVEWKE